MSRTTRSNLYSASGDYSRALQGDFVIMDGVNIQKLYEVCYRLIMRF